MSTFSVVTGGISGTCRDGVAVVFPYAFPAGSSPKVIFGAGGKTYHQPSSGSSQGQVFTATNVTNTGFTPSLKIQINPGSAARSATFSPSPGAPSTATKGTTPEAVGPTYTANFSVTVKGKTGAEPDSGGVRVNLYTRPSGGSFTLSSSREYYSDLGADKTYSDQTLLSSATGLGLNAEFELRLTDLILGDSAHSLTASTVTWDESSSGSTVTATPAGFASVYWLAILSLD